MSKKWIVVLVACLLVAGVLKMGVFDNLFGKKKANGKIEATATVFPWETHPSIYEHIKAIAKTGQAKPPGGTDVLPDEERIAKGGKLRWAAGAADGVLSHHFGGGKVEDDAAALLALLKQYCEAPSSENKLKVYEYSVGHPTLGLIDPLSELLRAERPNASRLRDLALSFATQGPDREPVKLGVGILGLFRGQQDKEVFLTLGRHDEFTLFCVVALGNTLDDAEVELWQLAQQVHGWGRIQTVERLAKTQNPQIQDWLLREGYKNSVMNEYLAYTCATGGKLKGALEKQDVDDGLLSAAGEIIDALISGGPAEGLSQYGDGPAVLEAYLKHLAPTACSLKHFLTVHAIQRWLEGARAWKGWTPEECPLLLGQCRQIMDRPTWKAQTLAGLKSEDAQVFFCADQAADVLGIETWTYHWERLNKMPTESGHWYPVMAKCNAERIAEVIALAEKSLPLEKIATGPALEMGLGKGFESHRCLDCVLQELGKFPGHGAALIRAGLHSPVVRNRNLAVKTLSEWGKRLWPAGMEQLLTEALAKEPDVQTRERMQRVLDGKSWDIPASQPSASLARQPSGVVPASQPAANRPLAKVKVALDGKVFLDEKAVSIDELKVAFATLKRGDGVVWYYREGPVSDERPEARLVIEAVVEAGLPIKLSSKPDYSDSIGPDGGSH